MKVSVYFNLHKQLLSVRADQGPEKGRVTEHKQHVWLKDVIFKVYESGRQRVLREKKKNVHAFVKGYTTDDIIGLGCKEYIVTYNPYKYNSFIVKDTEEPIFNAEYVKIDGRKIIAYVR